MTSNHALICPACDQGRIRRVRVEPCRMEGSVCTECEAFWDGAEQPDAARFMQLSQAVRKRGLSLSQVTLVWLE